jgi:hypothetical protein
MGNRNYLFGRPGSISKLKPSLIMLGCLLGAIFASVCACGDGDDAIRTDFGDDAIRIDFWMQDMAGTIGDRPMTKIAIPGTHDTGTYDTTTHSKFAPGKWDFWKSLAKKVTVAYSRTQDHDIGKQLMDGNRYFDLRLSYIFGSGENFHTFHTLEGTYFQDLLDALKGFLDEHPKEIVILDFRTFAGFDDPRIHETIFALISWHLGEDRLVPSTGTLEEITPNGIWAAKQQVIVRYSWAGVTESEYSPWIRRGPDWQSPEFKKTEPWMNTTSVNKFTEGMEKKLKEPRDTSKLYVMQGVLTPDQNYITWHLFGSLKKNLAEKINPKLTELLTEPWRKYNLNIVTADYYDSHGRGLIDAVIALNH